MPGIDPALLRVKDEEWAYLNAAIQAGAKWLTRIRNNWGESTAEEHATIPAYSQALLDAHQRTCIYGRPGIKIQSADPPPIKNVTVHDSAFVDSVLRAHVPAFGHGVDRIVMDSNYYMTDKAGVTAILAWDVTDKIRYESDRFDCDKFARIIWGRFPEHWRLNQMGMVVDWASRHAYNCTVFDDGDLWSIEPQTDGVITLGQSIYQLTSGLILL